MNPSRLRYWFELDCVSSLLLMSITIYFVWSPRANSNFEMAKSCRNWLSAPTPIRLTYCCFLSKVSALPLFEVAEYYLNIALYSFILSLIQNMYFICSNSGCFSISKSCRRASGSIRGWNGFCLRRGGWRLNSSGAWRDLLLLAFGSDWFWFLLKSEGSRNRGLFFFGLLVILAGRPLDLAPFRTVFALIVGR